MPPTPPPGIASYYTPPLMVCVHLKYFCMAPVSTEDLLARVDLVLPAERIYAMTDYQSPDASTDVPELWALRKGELRSLLDRLYTDVTNPAQTHLVITGHASYLQCLLLGREIASRGQFNLVTFVDATQSAMTTHTHIPFPTFRETRTLASASSPAVSPPSASPHLAPAQPTPGASQQPSASFEVLKVRISPAAEEMQGVHLFVDFMSTPFVPCGQDLQTVSIGTQLSSLRPDFVHLAGSVLADCVKTLKDEIIQTGPIIVGTTGPAPLSILLGFLMRTIIRDRECAGHLVKFVVSSGEKESFVVTL